MFNVTLRGIVEGEYPVLAASIPLGALPSPGDTLQFDYANPTPEELKICGRSYEVKWVAHRTFYPRNSAPVFSYTVYVKTIHSKVEY